MWKNGFTYLDKIHLAGLRKGSSQILLALGNSGRVFYDNFFLVGRCLAWALTHGKIIIFHLVGKIYLPHTTRQPSFQDLPKISSVPKAHSFLQASLSESRSFIRTDTSFSFQSKTYWHANLNSAETVPASLQCKDSFSSMKKFREVKVKELTGYLTCT